MVIVVVAVRWYIAQELQQQSAAAATEEKKNYKKTKRDTRASTPAVKSRSEEKFMKRNEKKIAILYECMV